MTTRFATCGLLAIGAITLAAAPRSEPLEHFTARAVEMTSLARGNLRRVDIVITRWSSADEHRMLEATLLDRGPVAFLDRLCDLAPAGSISTIVGREVTIRYAWEVAARDGSRRIFLASDEPISLFRSPFFERSTPEPLTFLEISLGPTGDGEGKLSEAARLSVDESRGVIELRDYSARPLNLMAVQSAGRLEE